jgi:hypothetical protein
MENFQGNKAMRNINSSAHFHTVNGAHFHTVRSARESVTVRFSTPSGALSSFPTVCFSTPFIEYAMHSVSFRVSFLALKKQ